MTLSAHQPAYLPWLGYFNKIARSDVFVILDDVAFEKGSFINRNRIKTPQGVQWLTVPVKSHGKPRIKDTAIDGHGWHYKHITTLHQNYRKSPWYGNYAMFMDGLICGLVRETLRDVNYLTAALLQVLGIRPPATVSEGEASPAIWFQSTEGVGGAKQDLILNLCRHFGADRFLFGSEGRGYADVEWFRKHGVECEFQDYHTPEYPQLYGEFVPDLSVVDALFNVGPERTREMIMGGNR